MLSKSTPYRGRWDVGTWIAFWRDQRTVARKGKQVRIPAGYNRGVIVGHKGPDNLLVHYSGHDVMVAKEQ
eukprot:5225043-Prorocentrum_lima.AAC.1